MKKTILALSVLILTTSIASAGVPIFTTDDSGEIKVKPTKQENVCDCCQSQLILRDDDKPETVKKRLTVYHAQTQPLLDYYTKQDKLVEIDGTIDIEDVFQAIVNILGE